MSYSWRGGSSRRQRRIRLDVMVRDGWICQLRAPGHLSTCPPDCVGCTGRATQAHHTLGRSVTGDDPRYMVASCEHCNLKVGDPTKAADPQPRGATQW